MKWWHGLLYIIAYVELACLIAFRWREEGELLSTEVLAIFLVLAIVVAFSPTKGGSV